MKKGFWIKKIIAVILIAPIAIAVFGWIVMWLWNHTLPDLLGVKMITFWQALGVLLLSKILFGGFRGGRGRARWGDEWKSKWKAMSPEERQQWKEQMRNRCGTWRNQEKNKTPFSPEQQG
jgi:Ca2+/H+ antiporter, TMEM165/GDT1 family